MFDALNLDPVAFTIPFGDGFPIYWYAFFVTLGIGIGSIWAGREIEKRGYSSDEFYNGLLIVLIPGYLFARLVYVLLDVLQGNAARYASFIDVINLRAGGANILGGFIGATLIAVLYLRWRKQPLLHYADVAGMTLLLAQAIGRWGNLVNQELYGPPTMLAWGLHIEQRFRLAEYIALPPETRFHPTFLYESLWLFAGFFALLALNARFRNKWRPGTLFGLFLLWWGGGRFVIEFFRPDQPTFGDTWFTYSMLMSLFIGVAGALFLLYLSGRLPEPLQQRLDKRAQKTRVYKPKPRRSK